MVIFKVDGTFSTRGLMGRRVREEKNRRKRKKEKGQEEGKGRNKRGRKEPRATSSHT